MLGQGFSVNQSVHPMMTRSQSKKKQDGGSRVGGPQDPCLLPKPKVYELSKKDAEGVVHVLQKLGVNPSNLDGGISNYQLDNFRYTQHPGSDNSRIITFMTNNEEKKFVDDDAIKFVAILGNYLKGGYINFPTKPIKVNCSVSYPRGGTPRCSGSVTE